MSDKILERIEQDIKDLYKEAERIAEIITYIRQVTAERDYWQARCIGKANEEAKADSDN